MRFLNSYAFTAASGKLGPKLREGDLQVPEGIYRISFLNANSTYHLSLRVDYPNAIDRANAAQDGRQRLGGDIMIHGKAASIGCIAIGDEAIEELFTLAAHTGIEPRRRWAGSWARSPRSARRGRPRRRRSELGRWHRGRAAMGRRGDRSAGAGSG